ITGDSFVINLKRMYGLDKNGHETRKLNIRSLREIVKYVTKVSDFAKDSESFKAFIEAFKNVRRVQSFGSFLGQVEAAEQEAAGPAESEKIGCKCGKCRWRDGVRDSEPYHARQTEFVGSIRKLKVLKRG